MGQKRSTSSSSSSSPRRRQHPAAPPPPIPPPAAPMLPILLPVHASLGLPAPERPKTERAGSIPRRHPQTATRGAERQPPPPPRCCRRGAQLHMCGGGARGPGEPGGRGQGRREPGAGGRRRENNCLNGSSGGVGAAGDRPHLRRLGEGSVGGEGSPLAGCHFPARLCPHRSPAWRAPGRSPPRRPASLSRPLFRTPAHRRCPGPHPNR